MKIQDSSFNGLKVTVGTKSVTHPRTHALTDAPKAIFQSWGHNNVEIVKRWFANDHARRVKASKRNHTQTLLQNQSLPDLLQNGLLKQMQSKYD